MSQESPESEGEVSQVLDHLFRHESGKIVASLTRIFGLEHLALAEDVVQDALAKAMQTWPFYGMPENPAGWIMRAARNLALDHVRRAKVFRDKEPEIIRLIERDGPDSDASHEISDDRLRMMFVCCHPKIPAEAQVAFALKVLGGFSAAEIAKALLTTEAAITKRLTRARQQIRTAGIRFEIPEGGELNLRIETVLKSLYLLFNEGYKASSGDRLVREDVCFEAIRLTELLANHPVGNLPRTHALLALMLLNSSRLSTRVDANGALLRLKDQDRARWDQSLIARGMYHLATSTGGEEMTAYHLQAGIAAEHCYARDYSATNWSRIVELYDQLVRIDNSPVAALNRAVAVGRLRGPRAGKEAVSAINRLHKLDSYHLMHAAMGEFEYELECWPAAERCFEQALTHSENEPERRFLTTRLEQIRSYLSPGANQTD